MPNATMRRLSQSRAMRTVVGRPFLDVNLWIWRQLPARILSTNAACRYGVFLQSLVRLRARRAQLHGTFFLRNRPLLELLRRIAEAGSQERGLKIAVIGCSNGAEVYSIAWALRSAYPQLNLTIYALDISTEILEVAREGFYSFRTQELIGSPIFERLTDEEAEAMFNQEEGGLRIRQWLREGIEWQVADAGDPNLNTRLGRFDIVVANNFLCHMAPADSEPCLRNMAKLVRQEGHMVVSGVDLEVRSKVALDLGWSPLPELLEEIHDGDPSVRGDWPWRYWGVEPLDRTRADWKVRYASVFQINC